ncbi:MAG: contact-dependent growth inhibition system immunity protein [Chitinophagales bacterium]
MKRIRDKTLEQLENEVWGEPGYPSHLVITVHKLRKKPLEDFTIEDLRIVIGQSFSLEYLIPIAIEKLQVNILAEGDMYDGDLLNSVLSADPTYWQKNKKEWQLIVELVENKKHLLKSSVHSRQLLKRFESFLQIN